MTLTEFITKHKKKHSEENVLKAQKFMAKLKAMAEQSAKSETK